MSAHTPGPWTVEIDRWHYDTASTVVAGAERPTFPFRELLVQVGGTDVGRQEANARLIAAAPELLEALEGLCGLAELRPGHLQDYKAAVAAARAAIAKSKGGAA